MLGHFLLFCVGSNNPAHTYREEEEGKRNTSTAMGGILQRMLQTFYTKKLEVVLVGLENRSVLLICCHQMITELPNIDM